MTRAAKTRTVTAHTAQPGARRAAVGARQRWILRLYVAGPTPKCLAAFANLKRLCDEHLKGQYQIEVIDLLTTPQLARGDEIVAIPTLVRRLPLPLRRMIGDLSNTERVLVGLQIRRAQEEG